MNNQQKQIITFSFEKRLLAYLPIVWILGVILGVAIVGFNGDIYAIVNTSVRLRPNLGILYLVNLFPIAVLAALITVRRYSLIYLLLFLYGLFRGFCGMCTVLAFGSGSWLVRSMHLFSCSLVSVLMWWLIYSYTKRKYCRSQLVFVAVLLISIVTLLDYFVVSPVIIGVI